MTCREAAKTLEHFPEVILTDRLKVVIATRLAVALLKKEAEKIEAAEDAEVIDI